MTRFMGAEQRVQRSHHLRAQSGFSTLDVQLNQSFPLVSKYKERTDNRSELLDKRKHK